ncbi:hypothetical protein MYX84_03045 [Acidobacteria bacterium AH-259-O06]|nr:hypothetical protein [Acidobacteria bacterium AH-259-O06]
MHSENPRHWMILDAADYDKWDWLLLIRLVEELIAFQDLRLSIQKRTQSVLEFTVEPEDDLRTLNEPLKGIQQLLSGSDWHEKTQSFLVETQKCSERLPEGSERERLLKLLGSLEPCAQGRQGGELRMGYHYFSTAVKSKIRRIAAQARPRPRCRKVLEEKGLLPFIENGEWDGFTALYPDGGKTFLSRGMRIELARMMYGIAITQRRSRDS